MFPEARGNGLRADRRTAAHRPPAYPNRRRNLRHIRLELLKIGALVRISVRCIKRPMRRLPMASTGTHAAAAMRSSAASMCRPRDTHNRRSGVPG